MVSLPAGVIVIGYVPARPFVSFIVKTRPILDETDGKFTVFAAVVSKTDKSPVVLLGVDILHSSLHNKLI